MPENPNSDETLAFTSRMPNPATNVNGAAFSPPKASDGNETVPFASKSPSSRDDFDREDPAVLVRYRVIGRLGEAASTGR